MGGNNRKKPHRPKSRGPGASSASRGLFVEGGLLSDWSPFNTPPSRGTRGNQGGNRNSRSGNEKGSSSEFKPGSGSAMRSQSSKSKGNDFRYVYPQESTPVDGGENHASKFDGSNPIVLIDSEMTPIVAYIDEGPVKKSQHVNYIYDYTSSFTLEESSHRGLGFHDEAETAPEYTGSSLKVVEKERGSTELSSSEASEMDGGVGFMDVENAELGKNLLTEVASPEENQGYILIGGSKIYTEDISDEDEEGEEMGEDESSDSSDSDDGSETSESDDSSSSGSDIDDAIAKDYFEGIGGIENVVNVDQLVGQRSDASDDDSDVEDGVHGTMRKLSGIALQEASKEYGVMNPGSGRKYGAKNNKSRSGGRYAWSSSLDDLMFVKDPRTVSGRKKHVARLPQSLPSEGQKGKKFRRIPGEKKKHRKEMIAVKRRDRMLQRGVDLQKINLKLQQIVLDGGIDMYSFQPMHTRDCSQVRRLAAIYRLQSGCQGSGKKRFVTVMRTHHTSMPSASDTIRLEKLMGPDEGADFSVIDGKHVETNTTPIGSKSSRDKSNKNYGKEAKKNKKTGKVGSYAAQPLSFVSSGILNADIDEVKTIESKEIKDMSSDSKSTPNSVEYGAFEMHTTGFGSKMLAKMGYIEGSGLGKEGQGMAQPIEVFQRPKSLGLGADVPETSGKSPDFVENRAKPVRRDAKPSGKNDKSKRKEVVVFPKLGSFERHTKGFGSKIMAKMGFVEGEGLGRDSQGIVNPLLAVRRPKARGLGATS